MDYGLIKDSYDADVEKVIEFSGQRLAFFTEVKVRSLLNTVRKRSGDPSRMRALDMGCGVGVTDRLLAKEFGALYGIDIAKESLEVARRTNPQVHYQVYDGSHFPFTDESFDLVFSICVVQCIPKDLQQGILGEMYRVLRPGGMVILYEHNGLNPLTRLAARRFDPEFAPLGVFRSRQLMKVAGFGRISTSYILFFPWKGAFFRKLEDILGKLPMGAQYFTVGEKTIRL